MRGTLDLLILRALTTGPDHGLGIARRVEQITQGAFRVNPGSLFPALHRLAQKGWLTDSTDSSGRRRTRSEDSSSRAVYVHAIAISHLES